MPLVVMRLAQVGHLMIWDFLPISTGLSLSTTTFLQCWHWAWYPTARFPVRLFTWHVGFASSVSLPLLHNGGLFVGTGPGRTNWGPCAKPLSTLSGTPRCFMSILQTFSRSGKSQLGCVFVPAQLPVMPRFSSRLLCWPPSPASGKKSCKASRANC